MLVWHNTAHRLYSNRDRVWLAGCWNICIWILLLVVVFFASLLANIASTADYAETVTTLGGYIYAIAGLIFAAALFQVFALNIMFRHFHELSDAEQTNHQLAVVMSTEMQTVGFTPIIPSSPIVPAPAYSMAPNTVYPSADESENWKVTKWTTHNQGQKQ